MMQRSEILRWLLETDADRLEELWRQADAVRRAHVGDAVHLRGLIEISNHCVRQCAYCGLRGPNTALQRYRMTTDEILVCAHQAATLGYGTVVLQAGEDPLLTRDWVADLVRRIKTQTGLAVTLSLGEQDEETFRLWRQAGADRYLLRFETSNRTLFDRIHPPHPDRRSNRIAQLAVLRQLDYEVGSGVMVGIPGQTFVDLAQDIELFRSLDLDMIGVGPWLPHPETPLGARSETGGEPSRRLPDSPIGDDRQVPNTELMTYKVVALARLVCPWANIPSTTALATLNRDRGRELGLQRGANVVMPNLTPPLYRRLYEVYPGKACLYETPGEFHAELTERIRSLGRHVGTGPGGSLNWLNRRTRGVSASTPAGTGLSAYDQNEDA